MFKIGDKVNLCNPLKSPKWKYKGVIGVVTQIGIKIYVRWDTNECVLCGLGCSMALNGASYWPKEIKLALRKGEQLLFAFML